MEFIMSPKKSVYQVVLNSQQHCIVDDWNVASELLRSGWAMVNGGAGGRIAGESGVRLAFEGLFIDSGVMEHLDETDPSWSIGISLYTTIEEPNNLKRECKLIYRATEENIMLLKLML